MAQLMATVGDKSNNGLIDVYFTKIMGKKALIGWYAEVTVATSNENPGLDRSFDAISHRNISATLK